MLQLLGLWGDCEGCRRGGEGGSQLRIQKEFGAEFGRGSRAIKPILQPHVPPSSQALLTAGTEHEWH